MKETRKYEILNRVFSKETVMSIGNSIYSAFQSSKRSKSHTSFSFKLRCADNTSYESESLELLENGSIADIKKVDSIDIEFYEYSKDRYMNFSIAHGETYNNTLLIRGNDSNWVNGMFTRIIEIIESAKPQTSYYLKHKWLFFHVIAFGIGSIEWALLIVILDLFYTKSITIENPAQWLILLVSFIKKWIIPISWLSRWGMGAYPSSKIQQYLVRLWPRIEFDFGPDHTKIERMRRSRVQFITVLGIIPIIAAMFYDIIKAILLSQ